MNNLAYSIIYPQPRTLTLGVVLALSLFSLTVNAQTVVRTGTGGVVSGNDIGEVQNAPGAAEGDVIKVSDGAAFNTEVTNPVSGFTVESATGNVVNVPVQAGYNFTQSPTNPFNVAFRTDPFNVAFRNVSFTGAENYTSNFWGGDLNQDNIIGITIDGKVSYSNFKDSVFDHYQTDTYKQYYPYKFTCTSGSSLTFSGNKTADKGAAICYLYELNGNGSFMTFSKNTANGTGDSDGGGAIYLLDNLSGSGNILEFSENTAAKSGGAIWRLGNYRLGDKAGTLGLSGNNNKLTFSKNTANGTDYKDGGGAIYYFADFSGSGNTLEFTENTAEQNGGAIWNLEMLFSSDNILVFSENTAAKSGGAIYRFGYYDGILGLIGNNNQLTFSKNTANGTGDTDGGGAIYQFNLSGSGNTLEFSENTAAYAGGAICTLAHLDGDNNTLNFSDNTAAIRGGAINHLQFWAGNNNKLTFSKNTANGTGNTDGGGAIYNLYNFAGSGNTLKFEGNTAADSGGAIYELTFPGSDNILEFSENTAAKSGGAIYKLGDLGNITSGLTGNNNQLTFSGNTAEKNGGAIYTLEVLEGEANKLAFTDNTAAKSGGAIYQLGNSSGSTGLTGNNNQLTFSKNKANGTGDSDGGGAIYLLDNLSGSGNILEFSENTAAKSGGAIYRLGYSDGTTGLTGNNNKLTFSNNKANGINPSYISDDHGGGGAIYQLALSGSGNTLEFTGNTAKGSGGAILQLTNFSTGSGNTLKFEGNTAEELYGGAVESLNLYGDNNIYTFINNTAAHAGGAVEGLYLDGNNNKLSFSNNTANGAGTVYDYEGGIGGAIRSLHNAGANNTLEFTGNTAKKSGGAINRFDGSNCENNKLTFTDNKAGTHGGAIGLFHMFGNGNTLEFTGNTAEEYGGAIGNFEGLFGSNNTLTFTGNTAGGNGGAIYASRSFEFNDNNSLTFTGNKAGTKGNDIYLKGYTSTLPANLTFSGGTYSFDGGIWLADETASTTISNGANVTIAGRDDDSVNEYEFRDVALTANLTATLDDIEYLHGNFTVGENGLMTIKKGSDTATIKSSTNYGVMDLVYNSEVETISISSGRIDIQGYFDGTVEVIDGATYSPGNSVGFTNVTGDVIIENGVILFEFGEYPDGDSNHDVLTVIDGSFSIESGLVNLLFENSDVSLWATEGAEYLLVSDDGFASETIDLTRFLGNYHGYFSLEGRTDGLYLVGLGTPVPEPSTWALLVLGAAGLAYMRKRSRQ